MTLLSHLSDLLLLLATGGMALYCRSLSRRLQPAESPAPPPEDRSPEIDAAVSDLAARLDALRAAAGAAHAETDDKAAELRAQIEAADDRIGRLELLLVGLEDIETDLEGRLDAAPPESEQVVPIFQAMRSKPDRSLPR